MLIYHSTCLLLGGNIGDRFYFLECARAMIKQQVGEILEYSFVYETAAWGNEAQAAYLNQALLVKTVYEPRVLLLIIQKIEKELGRVRNESVRWGARTIDIDILMYSDCVLSEPDLQIPHSMLGARRFMLVPMCDILGNWLHPIKKKYLFQMLEDCEDNLLVKRVDIV